MSRADNFLGEVQRAIKAGPWWRQAWDRYHLQKSTPSWLQSTDPLVEVYRRQGMLMREGRVVWGALVQANSMLFQPGINDHPAMVIHSADPIFAEEPDQLAAIARRLFQLKNTTPSEPSERQLAEMITDEMQRGMGWSVPKSCTAGRDVTSTTLIVFRSHLSDRILRCSVFPMLTHPETKAVMIVPSKYWPPTFFATWFSTKSDA